MGKFAIDTAWFFDKLREKGYSLRRFAGEMGMDASAVSRMLNGQRNMSADEQDRLARLLGLSLSEVAAHRGATAGGFGEVAQAQYAADQTKEPAKRGLVLDENGEWQHPIIGCMKGTMTILPGVDLTEPMEWDTDFDWAGLENE